MGCIGSKTKSEDVTAPSDEAVPDQPAPVPAPTTEASSGGGDFAKQLLDAQNIYRSKHGADPLELSEELSEGAQKWADHIASLGKLQHTSEKGVGENLAWSSGGTTAQSACDMWYNEITDYDFNNPGFTGSTGHFTQVVWKGSQKFGAGIATDAAGSTYVVGRYSPPGNISNPGYFADNVKPAN